MPSAAPFAKLKLRTNPFSPETLIDGRSVRFDFAQGPLVPQRDPNHLRYYFDLYKWYDHDQLGPMDMRGRVQGFPDSAVPGGLIVVISGVSGTGRTSLENLLFFEVKERAKSAPLHIRYTIEISANRVQSIQNLASIFIGEVEDYLSENRPGKSAKDLPKRLRATVKEWREGLVGSDPNSDFLFRQLARDIRRVLPETPIVFALDGSNHINTPDVWRPICSTLRYLADFVILSLSKEDHAAFLRTGLRDSQVRVVWIDAPRVDAGHTKRFLINRLAAERDGDAAPEDELFPFTESALRALFAPTEGADPVPLSIGVAIKKLKVVLEKKCADIAAALAGQPGADIARSRLEITESDMRALFDRR